MDNIQLTKEELESALWKKLEAALLKRLEVSRKINDTMQTEVNTTMLRGRINAYKEILWLNPENTDI